MSAAQNESLPQSQGTPIRSRVCPDINPMNGGVVDNSQAGEYCVGAAAGTY
jgi:hypothetical protein